MKLLAKYVGTFNGRDGFIFAGIKCDHIFLSLTNPRNIVCMYEKTNARGRCVWLAMAV